jgi:branched-chain amino acid transport system substrate-binding protein
MGRLPYVFLICALAISGCADQYTGPSGFGYPPVFNGQTGRGGPFGASGSKSPNQRVAILLPLSGPRSDLGQLLLHAAQLALPEGQSPALDVLDTTGTPDGAATAAHQAVSHDDNIILGPLTSAETAAVAPVAKAATIPVLAFTNDVTQAQPGVWPLGISPNQQVRRLVAAAQAQGRSRFAALLPGSEFGKVMASALSDALQSAGAAPVTIRFHSQGMASITQEVRDLADYADRRGPIDGKIRSLKAEGTPDARREILQLQKTPIPPAPFDTLLLADTGDGLQEIAAILPYYDIDRSAVQLMGPNLWADASSGASAVRGAWYAAPDNSARGAFVQEFTNRYGAAPPPIADLSYDAAIIARFTSPGSLTQRDGFVGSDGWIALLPDGHVRRGLAVFKVDGRGGTVIVPPLSPSSASGF